jgi:DNA polymerase III subunit delta'
MTSLIGHDENIRAIDRALASGKMHHGWIFAGPRGLGKASFAHETAKKLVDPSGKNAALIHSGNHPDIILVTRLPKELPKEGETADPSAELKRSISVDQIRGLQARLTTRPGMSDKRAIIIDAADDMERGAANALLKSLEEPPGGTYFFLVSHSSERLLPTIRSRCQILRFDPLEQADMLSALAQILPEMEAETRDVLAQASVGSPGLAMEFAGLDLAALEADMAAIIKTGDRSNALRVALAAKLSLKAGQARYEAFLRRVPQLIAEQARNMDIASLPAALEAWEAANVLAARAIGVSLDKQSVVLQMGSLLASLQKHKQRAD